MYPQEPTNNIRPEHLKKLDFLMESFHLKYAFEYLINNVNTFVEVKTREVEMLKQDKVKLIEKYEGIINIKKLLPVTPYKLVISRVDDLSIDDINKIFAADCLLSETNEANLKSNTDIIDAIVKTMEAAGISKSITKVKNPRTRTTITVDAEWFLELKNNYISKHHPAFNVYTRKYLDETYNLVITKRKANDEVKQKELLLIEKEAALKTQIEKEKRQEAILIAHTCIKFGFDPILITSRYDLDIELVKIGEVPKSVLDALKKELNFV